MNIEEAAFRDRRTLAYLNEKDLLDIIEFLQDDRKQWINQFSKTHNESIEIQQENKQLKERIEYLERSNNRREDTILEQRQEISDLEDNWNELKEFIKKSLEAIDTIQKLTGNTIENYTPRILTYNQILDKMQELEIGSYEED